MRPAPVARTGDGSRLRSHQNFFAPFSLLLPREIVSRLEQQELAMLRTLAQRPTRQFWCTGDGAFYRVFLRAEVA